MGKPSNEDTTHIQTLCEQGFGAKAMSISHLSWQNWSLSTLQTICRRIDETGSAVRCRAVSGRPVLVQLVDILKTLFKTKWAAGIHRLNVW